MNLYLEQITNKMNGSDMHTSITVAITYRLLPRYGGRGVTYTHVENLLCTRTSYWGSKICTEVKT